MKNHTHAYQVHTEWLTQRTGQDANTQFSTFSGVKTNLWLLQRHHPRTGIDTIIASGKVCCTTSPDSLQYKTLISQHCRSIQTQAAHKYVTLSVSQVTKWRLGKLTCLMILWFSGYRTMRLTSDGHQRLFSNAFDEWQNNCGFYVNLSSDGG